MVEITKNNHTAPAAKTPTRHPMVTPQHFTSCTKNKKSSSARKSCTEGPSSHGMLTRSRAKRFRLLDLPPEIRNHIYGYAFSENVPQSLTNLKLPPLLSVSKLIRTESVPILFATRNFTVTLRSNWCVRNTHFHGPEYLRHEEAGVLDLSPLLVGGATELSLDAIRFQHVDFCIKCICCVQALDIGSVTISIADRKPTAKSSVKTFQPESKKALNLMFEGMAKATGTISNREIFNGFTVEDVVEMAKCFKHRGGARA